jgi:hypothetical protein
MFVPVLIGPSAHMNGAAVELRSSGVADQRAQSRHTAESTIWSPTLASMWFGCSGSLSR